MISRIKRSQVIHISEKRTSSADSSGIWIKEQKKDKNSAFVISSYITIKRKCFGNAINTAEKNILNLSDNELSVMERLVFSHQ